MSFDLFAQIEAVAKSSPLGALHTLPVHKWDNVSINGKQTARVTGHSVSFDVLKRLATVSWTFVDLSDASKEQTISGIIDIGGHVKVTLDDDAAGPHPPANEMKPRIAARPIVTFAGVKISVELIFDMGGQRQDYRFDGVAFP